MLTLKKLQARQILDSRGNPTIEARLFLSDDSSVVASSPSGASVGTHEAVELRDNDPQVFSGKGVEKAIQLINTEIAQAVLGKNATSQKEIDSAMLALDGTANKSRLGANAILAVSIAAAKAGALASHKPLFKYLSEISGNTQLTLPKLLVNLINGGLHAGKNLDLQEFLVVPTSSLSIKEALVRVYSINATLRKVLLEMGSNPLVGDEGGLAPNLTKNEDVFSLLENATNSVGLKVGNDICFGLDAAADNILGADKLYHLKDLQEPLTTDGLSSYYEKLIQRFPLIYLEDPFTETDYAGWEKLMQTTADTLIITGDDLTVSNESLLKQALEKRLLRGIIIKPNQIGTVTEAMQTALVAKNAGLKVIVSHRSGETNDAFIADFALGVGAHYVKFGAPVRGERVAKYNRLLEIEEELS